MLMEIFRENVRLVGPKSGENLFAMSPKHAVVFVLVGLLVATAVVYSAAANMGFYPDDHWQHVVKLNKNNFDNFLQEAIDKGKVCDCLGMV